MYLPDNHPLKEFFGFFIMTVFALSCVGLLLFPTILLKSYKWAFLIYCVFLLIVSVAAFMTCLKHMFDND